MISLENLIPEGIDHVTRIRGLPRCLWANCLPLLHAKPQTSWLLLHKSTEIVNC